MTYKGTKVADTGMPPKTAAGRRVARQIEEAYRFRGRLLTDDDIAGVLLHADDDKLTRCARVGVSRQHACTKRSRLADLTEDQLWELWAKRESGRHDRHSLHTTTATWFERVELDQLLADTGVDEPLFVMDDEPIELEPGVCKIQPGCWMFGDHHGAHEGEKSVLQRLIEMDPEAFEVTGELDEELRYFDDCNADAESPPLFTSDDVLCTCLTREHTIAEACEVFRCGGEATTLNFRVFKPRGETYA